MTTKEASEDTRWLLLIHQLPAKPAYARVKVWRRLQALGAVTVKGAVYALPANAETREDFAWLAKEIVEGGGRRSSARRTTSASPRRHASWRRVSESISRASRTTNEL
jgi:hypothetical protein